MELLKTQNLVWHYLCEKRGEILYRADEAEVLHNTEGSKIMKIAADSIYTCMHALNNEK